MKKNFIVLIIISFLLISCSKTEQKITSEESKPKNQEKITKEEEIITISSLDDAKKCAVGTWQFTNGQRWEKLILKENGTYENFQAYPRDGKWHIYNQGAWDVGTDRDEDTGKRYYYFVINFTDKQKNFDGKYEKLHFKIAFQSPKSVFSNNFSAEGTGIGDKTDKSPWDE